MKYYFEKIVNKGYDEAVQAVTAALKTEGFGVLSDIDVQATLKEKIGADVRKYRILGACNPPFAHKAINTEENIGLMMPCNVVVQETNEGKIKVSAIDPVAAMGITGNNNLSEIAAEVSARLGRVINGLN
ncbi:MAG: DUF302 domain-containing protein [Ignavibacteriales bacterium]|nr:MAG: DUF302 domain-containing protein [Ignavibacteriaceae bacterium]MBW7872720.1 DUF302 domain-containing protein [Ignavibacteria bacterium]MCZ2143440.1 DUF302 domain-containing protein [Ignavibacteriales bacterium]OQY76201.1 MAG: hypothetical protein B6D45_04315 [Ignavibacteriales bacterium UTCHB3]MBV6444317.1 hypothetical protein [Ignavibacteriaceae bacterium]